jgi:hypothetical protein
MTCDDSSELRFSPARTPSGLAHHLSQLTVGKEEMVVDSVAPPTIICEWCPAASERGRAGLGALPMKLRGGDIVSDEGDRWELVVGGDASALERSKAMPMTASPPSLGKR